MIFCLSTRTLLQYRGQIQANHDLIVAVIQCKAPCKAYLLPKCARPSDPTLLPATSFNLLDAAILRSKPCWKSRALLSTTMEGFLLLSVSDIIKTTRFLYDYVYTCRKLYLHDGLCEIEVLLKDLQDVENCLCTFDSFLNRLTWAEDHNAQRTHHEALEQTLQGCKNRVDAFVQSIKTYEETALHPTIKDGTRTTIEQWLDSDEIRDFKNSIAFQKTLLNVSLDDLSGNTLFPPKGDDLGSENGDWVLPTVVSTEYSTERDRKHGTWKCMQSVIAPIGTAELLLHVGHLVRKVLTHLRADNFQSEAKDLDPFLPTRLDEYPVGRDREKPGMVIWQSMKKVLCR